MSLWLETVGVALVAALGIVLGRRLQRFDAPVWVAGYVVSLALIAMLALSRCNLALHFKPPFSWIAAGWLRGVALALAITLGTSALLPRLPRAWERVAVTFVMILLVSWASILPCLAPALLESHLANLATTIDADGVCLQTTWYTCGPAAAVTALRQLGLPAAEGQIAVLSRSSPITGTLPALLSKALQDRYAADGLQCHYRPFESISELQDSGLTLAVMRDTFLLDHCVAVLDVSDETVTIADPSSGVRSMPRARFEAIWRFSGIVLQRLDS